MEKTKLTVRVPKRLLEEAKRYAAQHDTTLTRLISEYLGQLRVEGDALADSPMVRLLSGILSPEASTEEYRAYLEEKYGSKT